MGSWGIGHEELVMGSLGIRSLVIESLGEAYPDPVDCCLNDKQLNNEQLNN